MTSSDDEQKTERFNMFMSPSEMREIDEWAWAHRVRSKSEAVRRLVQIGLRTSRQLVGVAVTTQTSFEALIALNDKIADALEEGQSSNEKHQAVVDIYLDGIADVLEAAIISREKGADLVREVLQIHKDDTFEAVLAGADEERRISREAEAKIRDRIAAAKRGIGG